MRQIPLPCFLYRDGEHFSLPPRLQAVVPNDCQFIVRDGSGVPRANPRLFREVSRPEDAEVFLFPWDIGQYIDGGALDAIAGIIKHLPHIAGRERRHIVCDDGDATVHFPVPVCLFKISVTKALAAETVAVPYRLPAHVLDDTPVFDWKGIRYDTTFVGNLTNPVRRAVVTSVQRQGGGLRALIDYDDAPVTDGLHCFNTRVKDDPEKTAARQKVYRKSLKESLTVLCPPGIGPHSIRMYETMYMGRIPILFGDSAVYPLERIIDYGAFCLRVPKEMLLDTGTILEDWLKSRKEEGLHAMCVQACRTWNTYFAPDKFLPYLLEEARSRFWEGG